MSATGRGLERMPLDNYPTPDWLTRAIVPYLGKPETIFEPACGTGAMVGVLSEAFPEASVRASDITQGHDFLIMIPQATFDLIITNPPFCLAQEFVDRAMLWRKCECSRVAMLLRLNFLGSSKRAAWWRSRPMPSIYVTPRRPMFGLNKNGKMGSDSTEYAWFVWGGPDPATIQILPTEGK